MCKKLILLTLFLAVLGVTSVSFAEDLDVPSWAGAPGTIYGVWNFSGPAPSGDYGSGEGVYGEAGARDYPEEGAMVPHASNPEPDEFESIDDTEGAHQYMIQTWVNEGEWHETYGRVAQRFFCCRF